MVAPDHVISRRVIIALAVVAVAVACVSYYLVDPSTGLYPRCLFKQLTGLDCPGCGSQRAIRAMLHGDIRGAMGYNVFLPVALVLIALLLVARRHPRLDKVLNSRTSIIIMLIAIVGWTVIRNLLNCL